MRFKRILEGVVPYSGESLETYEKIRNKDSIYTNTLYYNKEFDSLWYEDRNGYIHLVKFQKFYDGSLLSLGFPDEILTKDNTFKQKNTIWALPIKRFKNIFKNQSQAERFVAGCNKNLDGVNVREAFEKIDVYASSIAF